MTENKASGSGREPINVLGTEIELSSNQPAVKSGGLCEFIGGDLFAWTCIKYGMPMKPAIGPWKLKECEMSDRSQACEMIPESTKK